MTALVPMVFGTTLGKIFQPLFQAMAWLIAFFYALVPNFAIAIALLTVIVMIVTAPLTVKSTKSMVAMQRLSPELKKLQQKYKGDRQKLNEEMMNLYKEHGVNPAGGCLPMIIQFPIFIILYDVIRGLTNIVKSGATIASQSVGSHVVKCASPKGCSDPRYIGTSTRLYKDIFHQNGKMPAFHIDLAQRVFGHHTFGQALPYIILVAVAIGLQYLQMRQLNSRNPAMAQANPQAQMMQRYMPLIFAVIYLNISAGVNVYFIVSTLCRIGIQEGVFRSGLLDRAPRPVETRLSGASSGGAPKKKTFMERLADAQRQAIEAQQARQAALRPGNDQGTDNSPGGNTGKATGPDQNAGSTGSASKPAGQKPAGQKPAGQKPGDQKPGDQKASGPAKATPSAQAPPTKARPPNADGGKASTNGRRAPGGASGNGSNGDGEAASKTPHSRSRAKRNRKAR
ncbi:MAG TPA: membrane protein insertase YidC [Acidimicrobiales bacterium]|nr:membrane protein insertase YidC [Acidimicrobiales bacterium]